MLQWKASFLSLLLLQLLAFPGSASSQIAVSSDAECSESDAALSLLQRRAHGLTAASHEKSPQSYDSDDESHEEEDEEDLNSSMALAFDEDPAALSLAEVCAGPGGNSNWYMKVSRIVTNNLGGLGPDVGKAKEMRLRVKLGKGKGSKGVYDLVITNTSKYYPKDPSKNGLIDGIRDFFRINTRGRSATTFKAQFVERGTNTKVKIERFFITWYDIDKTQTSLHEHLLVKNFARYTLTDTTKLSQGTTGKWKMFKAARDFKGTGVDFNPDALTRKQFDVSVLLQYNDFDTFNFKLKTSGGKSVGRNYMFSGTTKLFRECDAFDCDLWGDPHISGFDQAGLALEELPAGAAAPEPFKPFEIRSFDRSVTQLSSWPPALLALEQSALESAASPPGDLRVGDMWLVKSRDVHIQGRFGLAMGSKNAFLKSVAIGGPFLEGNTLVMGTNEGISLWNSQKILTTENTSFMSRLSGGQLVLARFHAAVQHIDKPHHTTSGVEVSLPSGVQVLLNRFDTWLGLRVHMSPRRGGQDGECGNFNGDPGDDDLATLQQRMQVRVQDGESIFHMPFSTWEAKHYIRKPLMIQEHARPVTRAQHEEEQDEEEEDESDSEELETDASVEASLLAEEVEEEMEDEDSEEEWQHDDATEEEEGEETEEEAEEEE